MEKIMSIRNKFSKLLSLVNDTPDQRDKIELLKENASQQLVHLLVMNWDTELEWHIPFGDPPGYEPFNGDEADTMLFNNMQILYIFQKGLHPNQINMKQLQRERKFSDLMGSISAADARLLWAVRNRTLEKIYPTITHDLVSKAFPGIIPAKGNFKEFEKPARTVVDKRKREELKQLQATFQQSVMETLPLLEDGTTVLENAPATHQETPEEIEKLLALHGINHRYVNLAPAEPVDIVEEEDVDKPIKSVNITKSKPKAKAKKKPKKAKRKAPAKKPESKKE